MSLTFVQGDDAPSIVSTLHLEDSPYTITNLTGATVRFQMRKNDDRRFTVNAAAQVTNAVAGAVAYDWGPNDLVVPGQYQIQWEVTFLGGRIQTTATTETLTIRRQ